MTNIRSTFAIAFMAVACLLALAVCPLGAHQRGPVNHGDAAAIQIQADLQPVAPIAATPFSAVAAFTEGQPAEVRAIETEALHVVSAAAETDAAHAPLLEPYAEPSVVSTAETALWQPKAALCPRARESI